MSALTFDSRRRSPDSQNLKLLVIPPNKVFAVCSRHNIFGFFTLWILRNFATKKVFFMHYFESYKYPFYGLLYTTVSQKILLSCNKQTSETGKEQETNKQHYVCLLYCALCRCVYYIVIIDTYYINMSQCFMKNIVCDKS